MKKIIGFLIGAYIGVSALIMRAYLELCNNKEARENFFRAVDNLHK